MKVALSIFFSLATGAALYVVTGVYISGLSPFLGYFALLTIPLALILNIGTIIKIRKLKLKIIAVSVLILLMTTSVWSGLETTRKMKATNNPAHTRHYITK